MIIGHLTENTNTETGEITLKGGVSFAGVDLDLVCRIPGAKAPERMAYEVFEMPGGKHARGNQGVIWRNTRRQDGSEFLGLNLDSTRLSETLNCFLTDPDGNGTRAIVWNRPRAKGGAQ